MVIVDLIGPSGSGKSTLLPEIETCLRKEFCLSVHSDVYPQDGGPRTPMVHLLLFVLRSPSSILGARRLPRLRRPVGFRNYLRRVALLSRRQTVVREGTRGQSDVLLIDQGLMQALRKGQVGSGTQALPTALRGAVLVWADADRSVLRVRKQMRTTATKSGEQSVTYSHVKNGGSSLQQAGGSLQDRANSVLASIDAQEPTLSATEIFSSMSVVALCLTQESSKRDLPGYLIVVENSGASSVSSVGADVAAAIAASIEHRDNVGER